MSYQIYFASTQPLEATGNPNFSFTIFPDGTIDDGGQDDNYCIFPLESEVWEDEIVYRAELQMIYTEGRARQVIEYIKRHLEYTDEIELWHVWLGMGWSEGWEDETVKIIRREVFIEDLAPEDIEEFLKLDTATSPSRQYCLVISA